MGADFEFAYVEFPATREEIGYDLGNYCTKLRIRIHERPVEEWEPLLGAVRSLEHLGWREGGSFRIGDRWVVLSGGMSWGDPPTPFYEQLSLLNESGLV